MECRIDNGQLKLRIICYGAGPRCSGLNVKQLHSCSNGHTHSGGTIRGMEEGDLQLAHCPSILPEVSGYHTGCDMEKTFSLPLQHTYLEVVGSSPVPGKKIISTKFNSSHEGMIPMLKLTYLSHFLPILIVCCY